MATEIARNIFYSNLPAPDRENKKFEINFLKWIPQLCQAGTRNKCEDTHHCKFEDRHFDACLAKRVTVSEFACSR